MPSKYHRVRVGECLSSIAHRYGFTPDVLWSHPRNQELRGLRPNMHQLVPDDEVYVPELRPRAQSGVTGKTHRFRRRCVPEKLRFRLEDEDGQPRAAIRYRLDIDGKMSMGKTDGDGGIEVFIPPDGRSAELYIEATQGEERYVFSLGEHEPDPLDPEACRMLTELGILGVDRDLPTVMDALRTFQAREGLPITGDADLWTCQALRRALASR